MNSKKNLSMNGLKVELKIRIGSKEISIKSLSEIEEGDEIELTQDSNDPLDILIGEKVIAKGKIIEKKDEFFIEITELL